MCRCHHRIIEHLDFCMGSLPQPKFIPLSPAVFSNVVHFYNTLEHIESPVRSIQYNDVDYTGYKGSLERHNNRQWCNLTKSITLSKYSGSWGFSKMIVSCCYEWSRQVNPSGWTNKQLVHGFQVQFINWFCWRWMKWTIILSYPSWFKPCPHVLVYLWLPCCKWDCLQVLLVP